VEGNQKPKKVKLAARLSAAPARPETVGKESALGSVKNCPLVIDLIRNLIGR
jgi:hypothetical protein